MFAIFNLQFSILNCTTNSQVSSTSKSPYPGRYDLDQRLRLASVVSNAGGLGIIGSGSMYPHILKEHIQKYKVAGNKPFAVNIPLLLDIDQHIRIIIEESVPIVFSSAGNPKLYTPLLKKEGIKVVHVVSSSKFAQKAEDAGCDAVVAEGFEAGGAQWPRRDDELRADTCGQRKSFPFR